MSSAEPGWLRAAASALLSRLRNSTFCDCRSGSTGKSSGSLTGTHTDRINHVPRPSAKAISAVLQIHAFPAPPASSTRFGLIIEIFASLASVRPRSKWQREWKTEKQEARVSAAGAYGGFWLLAPGFWLPYPASFRGGSWRIPPRNLERVPTESISAGVIEKSLPNDSTRA